MFLNFTRILPSSILLGPQNLSVQRFGLFPRAQERLLLFIRYFQLIYSAMSSGIPSIQVLDQLDWACLFFFFLFFLLLSFYLILFLISWKIIALQYCSGFCHTLKWISHGFTCVPHPDPLSHLPLHPIPLGLPSAPGPSACLMHPTWAGDLFHPR